MAACPMTRGDEQLEALLLELLAARGAEKTICPSEAARAAGGEAPGGWRPLMEPVRAAALRLADAGRIEFLQRGRVVDGRTAKGAVRLRLRGKRE